MGAPWLTLALKGLVIVAVCCGQAPLCACAEADAAAAESESEPDPLTEEADVGALSPRAVRVTAGRALPIVGRVARRALDGAPVAVLRRCVPAGCARAQVLRAPSLA